MRERRLLKLRLVSAVKAADSLSRDIQAFIFKARELLAADENAAQDANDRNLKTGGNQEGGADQRHSLALYKAALQSFDNLPLALELEVGDLKGGVPSWDDVNIPEKGLTLVVRDEDEDFPSDSEWV